MATTAPMHKNRTTTLGRINNFISKDSLFKSVNLSSKIYSDSTPFTSIQHWKIPEDEHGSWRNYTFEQVKAQTFTDVSIGNSFGPTWTTHWFKVQIVVPATWAGKEVHLRWNSNSEAMIWTENGVILQGLTPGYREEYIISKDYVPGPPRTYYIEMACNGMFGAGEGSDIAPPNPNKQFFFAMAQISVFERHIFKLYTDFEMLYQIADRLSGDHIGYQAMFCANEMVNKIINGEEMEASRLADVFFAEGNGKKVHRLISMGHCHIDTAWLWPYDETIRKCARSWSAQMNLMEEYPNYVFTCSQAQQFAWMKQYYPSLFARIKSFVASGKFVPVGGTWVEMDGNIPNGEAFMRQFFYGQRFFYEEFGLYCKEFWLPDTFGYSAQIPQMLKHVGVERFMTQKMSWNLVNKFPNHNFFWEGIDGSEVLVHFPPGNSYNMNATIEEILFSQNNSEDKGRANVGIYLYGYGDGGGGPTRTMIERQQRVQDVDGIPKVEFGTPEYFWTELEKESSKLYRWVGELYLELHNATYTSQAKIKWYNRKCEFIFREIELLLAMAYTSGKVTEAELRTDVELVDTCWKDFLLNQFHDVLPGSCIELIVQDAWKLYENIFTNIMGLRLKYHALLLGSGTTNKVLYNPLSWDVKTVIFNKPDSGAALSGTNIQEVKLQDEEFEESIEGRYRVPNSFSAALVQMTASGYTNLTALAPTTPVTYTASAGVGTLSNGILRLEVTTTGVPAETLYLNGANGKEVAVYNDRANDTSPGMLYIYDDVPLFWDAWDVNDFHLETKKLPDFREASTVTPFGEDGPIVAGYKWSATFGEGSTMTRYTIMRADSPMIEYLLVVDWKESHKFLKAEFPVDILSREATYEVQYGHLKRPTHINTSWDMAKYEVCGHKWMDISQADKGVTFITDSKYGWNCRGNIVRLSLLRAPKNPDANCDIHKHYIHYAVLPHEGTFQQADVVRRAYELNYFSANNVQLSASALATVPANTVNVDSPAVIIEAYKGAHDIAGAVLVRLYESHGGSSTAKISLGFTVTKVNECNGLEILGAEIPTDGNSFEATFTPFQVRSFIVYFDAAK